MNIRVFRYLSIFILLPAFLGASKTGDVNPPSDKDGTLIVGVTWGDIDNTPATDAYIEAHGFVPKYDSEKSFVLKMSSVGQYESPLPPGVYDVFVSEGTTADGSLYFSILDLAKWDEALREGKFVSSASYKLMWTPFVLNDGKPNRDCYGFGWFIGNTNGHRVIEHAGAWLGFNTNISRYVDDGLTVVMLTNLDGANPEDITHTWRAS